MERSRPPALPETDATNPVRSPDSRVLALDLGARRIGLAVSDPLGLTAQGLPTMERRNKKQDLNFLRSLARRYEVSLILVGNPLNMNGSEGPQSAKAQSFAKELGEHLGVEVQLWDERLTSVEAHRVLDETGAAKAQRGGTVDRLAAVLLLQNFLESRRARTGKSEPRPRESGQCEPRLSRAGSREPSGSGQSEPRPRGSGGLQRFNDARLRIPPSEESEP